MLAIYAYVADAFDREEVLLLQEMADDLAFGIVHWREAAAREQAEQRLVFEISHDSLTGLPKREVFLDRAGQAIRRAERENSGLAVMLVKAGRYRSVVSAFDHNAGDALIKEVGARLQSALRAGDTVARIGNDDFAVLVCDLGEEQNAAPLAEKLLASLSPPLDVCGQQVYADALIGICLYPRDGEAADVLLRNAEAATNGAQIDEANALQFYSTQMNKYASERLALEIDFHRAVNAGEMRVYLQPKANLHDGHTCGAEALVRWQYPRYGLLAPSRFIGLAEETGLIIPLSEWIIREVCTLIAKWQATERMCVPVAINISPRHLRHANLVPLIRECLRTHDVAADMVEVEITESVLLTDGEASVDVLRQLRALGLHLALDDFGTGFSSLSYLRRLPVDCVKIDQSFVSDITTNPESAAICSAIVSLAHALRLRVIAEGVETEGQFSYLRNLGCDEMQGYYLHRPMPADEFPGFLRRGRVAIDPARRWGADQDVADCRRRAKCGVLAQAPSAQRGRAGAGRQQRAGRSGVNGEESRSGCFVGSAYARHERHGIPGAGQQTLSRCDPHHIVRLYRSRNGRERHQPWRDLQVPDQALGRRAAPGAYPISV